ncbi:MAG: ankyrin repeat domain-containing protein [Candidatus Brocadiia bacterium]
MLQWIAITTLGIVLVVMNLILGIREKGPKRRRNRFIIAACSLIPTGLGLWNMATYTPRPTSMEKLEKSARESLRRVEKAQKRLEKAVGEDLRSENEGPDLSAREEEFLTEVIVGDTGRIRAMLQETPELVKLRELHLDTPLHSAVNAGLKEREAIATIRVLLEHGAAVDTKNVRQETALHRAAFEGKPGVCSALLKAGANPNSRDQNGMTPLHAAALEGQLEVCRVLLGGAGRPQPGSIRRNAVRNGQEPWA